MARITNHLVSRDCKPSKCFDIRFRQSCKCFNTSYPQFLSLHKNPQVFSPIIYGMFVFFYFLFLDQTTKDFTNCKCLQGFTGSLLGLPKESLKVCLWIFQVIRVIEMLLKNSLVYGVVHKLRGQNFTLFWPCIYVW